jgi:hypothetical protein
MKKVNAIFEAEIYSIYEYGNSIPIHTCCSYAEVCDYCNDNDMELESTTGLDD